MAGIGCAFRIATTAEIRRLHVLRRRRDPRLRSAAPSPQSPASVITSASLAVRRCRSCTPEAAYFCSTSTTAFWISVVAFSSGACDRGRGSAGKSSATRRSRPAAHTVTRPLQALGKVLAHGLQHSCKRSLDASLQQRIVVSRKRRFCVCIRHRIQCVRPWFCQNDARARNSGELACLRLTCSSGRLTPRRTRKLVAAIGRLIPQQNRRAGERRPRQRPDAEARISETCASANS